MGPWCVAGSRNLNTPTDVIIIIIIIKIKQSLCRPRMLMTPDFATVGT